MFNFGIKYVRNYDDGSMADSVVMCDMEYVPNWPSTVLLVSWVRAFGYFPYVQGCWLQDEGLSMLRNLEHAMFDRK